jgi:muconolactone delta-isomerase
VLGLCAPFGFELLFQVDRVVFVAVFVAYVIGFKKWMVAAKGANCINRVCDDPPLKKFRMKIPNIQRSCCEMEKQQDKHVQLDQSQVGKDEKLWVKIPAQEWERLKLAEEKLEAKQLALQGLKQELAEERKLREAAEIELAGEELKSRALAEKVVQQQSEKQADESSQEDKPQREGLFQRLNGTFLGSWANNLLFEVFKECLKKPITIAVTAIVTAIATSLESTVSLWSALRAFLG